LTCPKSDVLCDGAIKWLKTRREEMPTVFADKLGDFLQLGEELTVKIQVVEEKIDYKADQDEIVQLLVTIPGVGRR
ncbi:hypothetical protein KGY79_09960, partial [Candidatus Bipolaricaulota bacterium]|nr:hypothetical protein [Candidatus Bipolaricaulota bacterium]